MTIDLRRADAAFLAAWPAEEVEVHDGWLFRATSGVTRRGNSALALDVPSDLDAQLDAVVDWYRQRGLVPRIQVGPSSPSALARDVAARGWVDGDGSCDVLRADLGVLAAEAPVRPELAVELAPGPSREWVDVWWAVSPRGGADERAVAERILGRLDDGSAAFAVARDREQRPIACALGVAAESLLVVESAATLPDARRRGACRRLVAALAEWGQARGALAAVLSVELANARGLATWRQLGFDRLAGWRYLRYDG